MPLVGTDIEIVGYRQGDDLMLLVNKGGRAVYREKLPALFSESFEPGEFLVDDRHQAHRHLALMREYIEHHPVPPWRGCVRRWLRWV